MIIAELLPEKEEIQNEMQLLPEWASPSSRILMDILKFHTKSRSCFGLLSFAYAMAQRFSLSELQMNYLRCPYNIQKKISSYV